MHGRTSWLVEHGFEPLDVVAAVAALLLCIAYGSFFLVPSWTPRVAVLVAVAPLGITFMVIQAWRRDAISIMSLALVGIAVTAGIASGHVRSTLLGTVGTEESALILASSLGLLAIGRELTPQGRRATGWAFVLGAAMSCAVGLGQYFAKADGGIFAMVSERATGLTPNPVYFGAVAAGAFGVVVGRRTTSRRTLWFDLGLAVWFGVAISISGTRVALGAAILVASLVIITRRTWRPIVVFVALIGGLVVGSIITSTFGSGANAATRVSDGSSGDRRSLWADAFAAFRERPMFGWGPGEFRRAVQSHISIHTSRRFGAGLEQAMFDAHNTFFGVAVSLGAAGLIGVLILTVLIARRARGGLVVGAGALALSWMLQPMGLATFPLTLLLIGASLPSVRIEPVAVPSNSSSSATALGSRRSLVWLLAPGLVAGSYLVIVDVAINSAIHAGNPRRVESLIGAMPADPVLADLAAGSWRRDGTDGDPATIERVLYWSARARDLQSDRSRWWVRLGARQYAYGDAAGALESMQRARQLEPNAWSAVNAEMVLLDMLGERDEFDALTPLACELDVPACPTEQP